MFDRNAVRYDARFLPESLSSVVVSWEKNSSVESSVENFCSHGIRVSMPSSQIPTAIPVKNETVQVLIPTDSSQHAWFSGMCVYTATEQDSRLSMGIYFYNPSEQNHLHKILYSSLKGQSESGPFIPHEWEELVDRLCNSEDPQLNQIGCRERENMGRSSWGQ